MKKLIIILTALILLIVGILLLLHNNVFKDKIDKENINNLNTYIDIGKEDIYEDTNEIIRNDNVDIQDNNNGISNANKNNMEVNSTTNNNVIKKEEQKVQEKPKEEIKIIKEESKEIEPKKEIWDELGISEYDYYNKPMWSWARVDYSIKEYKTFEQTHQICIDEGNKLENILRFSCISINSYSGDYLGEMLKVKY